MSDNDEMGRGAVDGIKQFLEVFDAAVTNIFFCVLKLSPTEN